MNYTQNKITGSKITENQWQIGKQLNFSKFTSCIGIVGYKKAKNGNLFGIHLVQAVDDFFNEEDAVKVVRLVVANCEKNKVKLFGCIGSWRENPAFDFLIEALEEEDIVLELVDRPKGDGVYTATFNTINSGIDIVKG